MATKPVVAWQEQGPFSSLDELQVEEGAGMSHSCPPQDKRAPKATPEDDIDILEPGDDVKAPLQNHTIEIIQMENEDFSDISPCASRMIVPKEQTDHEEDAFPLPPSISVLSMGEYCEKEGFFSPEGEITEWISDAEIISDPKEDLTSLDSQDSQEWPTVAQIIEPVDQEVATISADNQTAEENDRYLPAHHPPSRSNNSDAINTMSSPPFADESEEEEEVGLDPMSCEHQWNTFDLDGQLSPPSFSSSQGPNSTRNAIPPTAQVEELFPRGKRELICGGVNQEAAQQVSGRGSPPVSAVSMAPSNQGEAISLACGCGVAARERQSRVGEKTEGENEQTGGEERRKESKLVKNRTPGWPRRRGLLRYSTTAQTRELTTERCRRGVSLTQSRMEGDVGDDSQSDSGLSADFSPGSTMEGNATTAAAAAAIVVSPASQGSIPTETPIEREIRRAVAREQSLRRSRGLPNQPTSPEYVEIPLRKTVLQQSQTSSTSQWSQAKDREFAGKKMQHEIHEETQREQALVKIGKIPGFYDKGTVRQIKDKKKLFEAFQTPIDPAFLTPSKCKALACSSDNSDVSSSDNQEDTRPTLGESYVKRRRSLDLLKSPNSTRGGVTDSAIRGPASSKETGRQVIILENNLSVPAREHCQVKTKPEAVTAVDSASPHNSLYKTGGQNGLMKREEVKQEEAASKENPFFKLRSSTNLVKVKQDILEAQEREKELHNQRISLYGGSEGPKEGGGGHSISVEETGSTPSPSKKGLSVPDAPTSSSNKGTGPSAAQQSGGRLCAWPPAPAQEETFDRTEVLQQPRTPRQKTPLVQRWESRQVNGCNLEED